MSFRIPALLFAVLLIAGCAQQTAETESNAAESVVFASFETFGEEIEEPVAVPVETLAADPTAYLGAPVTVSGTITAVCQHRGCWMTMQIPNESQTVRIVMPRDENNNYLFTLDADISGSRAIVQGMLDESTFAEFEAPMHGPGGDDHHEGEDHGDDHGDEEHGMPENPSALELHITAQGVMVEITEEATD